ncbi:MAG: Porphobilinogen deaminase [Candidatus Heimdallarchaeota archaeon LC_2]|nr:MAG: Porphobilinogen deaminase [Candidatus Heimdallarchaeota archaeon LC_2]
MKFITIGTRGSELALAQANLVKELIETNLSYEVKINIISSIGDKDQISQLHAFRGMGVFTSAIEKELLESTIDLAVHSLKDLPIENTSGLYLPALLKRHSPGDVILIKESALISEAPLQVRTGLRVATGSPRRQSQILAFEPSCIPIDIRGNVNTRISRLRTGFIDAIIMAEAVFDRINLELPEGIKKISLPADTFPCAPGQGSIAIQARIGELEDLNFLNDKDTNIAVTTERYILSQIGGGCDISLGLFIRIDSDKWKATASIASETWNPSIPVSLSRAIVYGNSINEIKEKLIPIYQSKLQLTKSNGFDLSIKARRIIIARNQKDSENYKNLIDSSLNAIIASVPIFEYIIDYTMLENKKLLNAWINAEWIVLTSQRPVEFLSILSKIIDRSPLRVATIGPSTAGKLRSYGFPVHLVANGSINELKELLTEARQIYPGNVLFLHGNEITDYPSEDAQSFQVYTCEERKIRLPYKPDDLIVFSKRSAESILKAIGKDGAKRWIAIGKTTGNFLKNKVDELEISAQPTPQGVLNALLK